MANRERGWLRKRERANGMIWLWCYQRRRDSNGKPVENAVPLGLVADIGGDKSAAWLKVGELGLINKHIDNKISIRPTFGELCSEYVKDGLPFRLDNGQRKANGTIETYLYHINTFILPRWRNDVAAEMKPVAIRNWLYGVHDEADYTWETCTKIKQIMSLVFSFVDDNEVYSIRNPLQKVRIPASEDEHEEVKVVVPEQIMRLLERLPSPVRFVALLVASTGIRISECLGLRWLHVNWNEERIQIEQTFRCGEVQRRTKTETSKGPVPMCGVLAECLAEWRRETPYRKDEDFIFASPTLNGRNPLWGQTINARYLKPAALALGLITEAERFGWHSFRHSFATWADEFAGDLSVPQMLLRHADPKTTELYVHRRFEVALEAQRRFMAQLLGIRPIKELVTGPVDTTLLAMEPASEAIQ